MITISSPDFTIESMRAEWADDETLTAAQVNACADAEYAYYVITVSDKMRGWSYNVGGSFTGPARNDAIEIIGSLKVEAVDYVVEHLDEIKTEEA